MKVYEVLDDETLLKTDVKRNKGKAVDAIVRGMKRKSNGPSREDTDVAQEINVVSE